MEFKIVDFLKSTEYEEGKKFANLSFVNPFKLRIRVNGAVNIKIP